MNVKIGDDPRLWGWFHIKKFVKYTLTLCTRKQNRDKRLKSS